MIIYQPKHLADIFIINNVLWVGLIHCTSDYTE